MRNLFNQVAGLRRGSRHWREICCYINLGWMPPGAAGSVGLPELGRRPFVIPLRLSSGYLFASAQAQIAEGDSVGRFTYSPTRQV
jgi:hypothetical protein